MKRLISSWMMLALLAMFSNAETVSEAHSHLTKALVTTIVQQKLAECNFNAPAPVSFGNGTMVTAADGEVSLGGHDHTGKAWVATYEAFPGAGCQLWQAHLEHNGEPALVFIQFGGDNSGGWDTTLSVLLFDAQGRPFPWQAKGKFEVTEHGVDTLVLLGKDDTPAVVVSTRQSDGPGNYHDLHTLYRFLDTRAIEITGDFGGVHWPLVDTFGSQKWAISPVSHTLTTSAGSPNTNEVLRDAPRFKGTKGTNDSDRRLVMSNKSIPLPDVLVLDSKSGRRIISSPMQSDLASVPVDRATGIALGNNCSEGDCHPVVMWLKQ